MLISFLNYMSVVDPIWLYSSLFSFQDPDKAATSGSLPVLYQEEKRTWQKHSMALRILLGSNTRYACLYFIDRNKSHCQTWHQWDTEYDLLLRRDINLTKQYFNLPHHLLLQDDCTRFWHLVHILSQQKRIHTLFKGTIWKVHTLPSNIPLARPWKQAISICFGA